MLGVTSMRSFLAVLLIIASMVTACKVSPSSTVVSVETSSNGLEYFGFAVVDCGWDDPHDDEIRTNYVDEVTGFTNVAQMCVYDATENLQSRIELFSKANIKALLHIELILFTHQPSIFTGSGVKAKLRSDAQERWNVFVETNRDWLNEGKVAGFYIADEPVWNGISEKDFTQAVAIVKESFPSIPTVSIEAYPVIDRIMVPETLDWVGFDYYDSTDPLNDPVYQDYLDTVLAARTRDDQRVVIVASTQWLPYYKTAEDISSDDMADVIQSYFDLAVSLPESIALIGYLWPGGLDDADQLGARELPENVQVLLQEIGDEIINGQKGK